MKVIAMYLPQFHSIPENDEWWGKGFTEWTNVKKSEPLYKNHNQPRVPLNNNYYSLLDDEAKKWQIQLAKQYGVYGFCYYHYWFNGKLLLEQPLEQVLENKDLDLPFCISWANEPWTRSWDGLTSSVIMEQNYSEEDDYNHFEYLLNFFKDDRYIKVNNKPVVLIYKLASIPNNGKHLVNLWNKLAKAEGFDGIYFVETLNGVQPNPVNENTDAAFYFEPSYTVHHDLSKIERVMNRLNNLIGTAQLGKYYFKTLSYDLVWKKIIKRNKLENKVTYHGCFVDWDNSPRRGNKSMIFNGANPNKFGKYLSQLAKKSEDGFVFVNAWNEWAEGTYLEPDKKNGYGYLEAIKGVIDENC